jgi:transposase InsO family protein
MNMALWNRRPQPGLIHHSDRGCQYTSLTFGRRCREAGIVPSMGQRADAYVRELFPIIVQSLCDVSALGAVA